MNLLELRKKKQELLKVNVDLKAKNEMLEKFSQKAALDLQSPLKNLVRTHDSFSGRS